MVKNAEQWDYCTPQGKCKVVLPFWKIHWKYMVGLSKCVSHDPGVIFLGMCLVEVGTQ